MHLQTIITKLHKETLQLCEDLVECERKALELKNDPHEEGRIL
jgi:hypothetical protein